MVSHVNVMTSKLPKKWFMKSFGTIGAFIGKFHKTLPNFKVEPLKVIIIIIKPLLLVLQKSFYQKPLRIENLFEHLLNSQDSISVFVIIKSFMLGLNRKKSFNIVISKEST